MAELSPNDKQLSNLSPQERRELLAALLKQKSARPTTFPLSFAQERLWFLSQFQPDSPAYNIPVALRADLVLDLEVLERSINEIVRRHEALRTTFPAPDGRPVQSVAASLTLPIARVDLRSYSAERREAEAARLADEEGKKPFDLARGPLLRTTLLRLGETDHLLLLTMHHIVSDGWSIQVFFRELSLLYEAFAQGLPSPLPPLPIQYPDFATWQREWLQGEVLEQQLAYWRTQLAGAPLQLELPADAPRPPMQTFNGSSRAFSLPPRLLERLELAAQREGATLFMVLLAGFYVLLARSCGERDLVVGSPIANRTRSELEGLIGFFVNTLVLRANLSGEPGFTEVVKRTRNLTLDAYAHQHLPFEQLVERLHPARSLSHNPLFQVMFSFQGNRKQKGGGGEGGGGGEVSAPLGNGTAKFDLTLSMVELPTGLMATLEFNTDLFEPPTVLRLIHHYENLLSGAVQQPERRIDDLPMLDPAERQQLLHEWGTVAAEAAGPGAPLAQLAQNTAENLRARCVHELVAEQAGRSPDAVALVYGAELLSYRELDRRANQLAHLLRELGAGPDACVGVCMERSLEMVVALLGVLKAGAAYLPLDPAYPAERLSFMVEDSRTRVVLVQAKPPSGRPPALPEAVAKVHPDRAWRALSGYSREEPPPDAPAAGARDLAYVMYTSGSTGLPKGVLIPHRAVHWLVSTLSYAALSPADRVAQASTSTFDAATFEIWGALAHGARLVGLTRDEVTAPKTLAKRLREEEITVLYQTAALFSQTVAQAPDALKPLRRALVGGESADVAMVRRALRKGPPERLLHVYGPTETTTFSSTHAVSALAGPPEGAAALPIGRPIARSECYLLDARLEPVPIGVLGELYIGGDGLARGYLNRPELTAERFVPHPFASSPGARLYRSGDLARYLPGGEVLFHGRCDQQVKVRGFRVEPGEIEAVLATHPEVAESVVALREDTPGNRRLVSYLVLRDGCKLEVEPLRAWLREKLPDYMVPALFVRLDALPLSGAGKVDRTALPAPDDSRAGLASELIAPRTPVEEVLAGIWSQVLGISVIGVHDNFFELGGHSLLATQIASRVLDLLGLEMPLSRIFEAPTVGGLAEKLTSSAPDPDWLEKTASTLLATLEVPEGELEAMLRERGIEPGQLEHPERPEASA